jgi:hypothetical protein
MSIDPNDPNRDPTPAEEAIHELQQTVARQEEQLREAFHIINEIEGYQVSEDLMIRSVLWLGQHSDLNK